MRIYIMYQHKCDYPFMLALTIALSIIATVILSKVIGSMLPMLAKKCRLDPAIMADTAYNNNSGLLFAVLVF